MLEYRCRRSSTCFEGGHKVKILHLIYDDINNPWCGGGGAVRAYEINRRLAQRHDITVATGNYPGARREVIDGVRYVRIGSNKSYLLSRVTFSLQALIKLKNFRYDILIDDFSPFSPCFASLYSKKPVVTSIQSYLGYHHFRKHLIAGMFSFLFEYLNLKASDFVITISPWLEEKIKSKVKQNAVVKCIFNGLNEEWFNISDFEEEDYILFIGRIDFYTKGIDILLKAFAVVSCKVPKVVLKLVGRGNGKDIRKTIRLIDRLDIKDKVQLIGPVYDVEEKQSLFAKSKFVCMPSRFEGWPIVSIEAAAAGKAVIGTKIPGLSDAVKDGETGILVPSDDPDELANAMIYLLEHKEERKRMGENGRKWARRFNWDEIAKEQEQFYWEVVKSARN